MLGRGPERPWAANIDAFAALHGLHDLELVAALGPDGLGYERAAVSGAYGERAEAPHPEHTACGKPGPGFDTVIEVGIAGDRIGRAPTPPATEEPVADLARGRKADRREVGKGRVRKCSSG